MEIKLEKTYSGFAFGVERFQGGREQGDVMKIKLQTNEYGFTGGKFQDLYGNQCSIQKSSLATENAIWLGQIGAGKRMYLDREMVAALLPLLQRFVKTGELEP